VFQNKKRNPFRKRMSGAKVFNILLDEIMDESEDDDIANLCILTNPAIGLSG